MRRFILGIGIVVALVATTRVAADDSVAVSALAGRAWEGVRTNCFFSGGGYSSGIQNTCTTGAAWLIPLPLLANNVRGIYITGIWASATGTGTGPGCRYVARNANDSELSMGDTVTIDMTDRNIARGTVNASANTSLHVDCWFPAATTRKLTQVRYTYAFVP